MNQHICPVCEVGSLNEIEYSTQIKHRGKAAEVHGLLAWQCSDCGERSMDPRQIRLNQTMTSAARKDLTDWERSQCDRLGSRDIVRLRESLHLTQVQACKVFGGGANAFSKYERGDVLQSDAMDLLMRCAFEVPGVAAFLLSRAMDAKTIPSRVVEQPGRWVMQRGFNPVQESFIDSAIGEVAVDTEPSREWKVRATG
jgi:HTH-type transcriptional regulator/antitoxin MqsA